VTAALLVHSLAPVLLALAVLWAAGLMEGGRTSVVLAVFLAFTLASGLAGLDAMFVRLVAPTLGGKEWLLEIPLAGLVMLWGARRPRLPWAASPTPSPLGLAWGVALLALLAVSLWASLCFVGDMFRLTSHGASSDAYAMWNLKARFLYHGGDGWTRLFDPELVHSRYPLLHPALVARLWGAVGMETVAVPQGLALGYFVLCVGLLAAALCVLRGAPTAALAGLGLLSLSFFTQNATYQGADLPLSLFALAASTCLALGRERSFLERRLLLLAGVFASLAAWTKVEGLLLVAALPAAVALTGGGPRGRRLRRALWVVAGAAPAVALLAHMNAAFPRVSSEYVQPLPVMLERALSTQRHAEILVSTFHFLTTRSQSSLALVALAAMVAGWRRASRGCHGSTVVVVVLLLVGVGFYVVYLTTPYDLTWQLATSLDRLFIQYWPALVFGTFSGAFAPVGRAHHTR
jgi:hypothetical protein